MNGWIITTLEKEAMAKKLEFYGDLEGMFAGAVKLVYNSEITYVLENGKPAKFWIQNKPVEPPDFFIFLDYVNESLFVLSDLLISAGAFCYNPPQAKNMAMSKIATSAALLREGLPVAKTMVIEKETDCRLVIENLGLPLIVKPNDGGGAIGVKLLNTEEELQNEIKEIDNSSVLLAQEFISTSKGRDLRIQIVGYKAVYSFEKTTTDPNEFRSYIRGGAGKATMVEMTDEAKELSEKAARAIGLRYCGVDLLYGPEGFIVGEINSAPGIKRGYGKEIAKFILSDLAECLKNHKANT